jgi:hypothetical protein
VPVPIPGSTCTFIHRYIKKYVLGMQISEAGAFDVVPKASRTEHVPVQFPIIEPFFFLSQDTLYRYKASLDMISMLVEKNKRLMLARSDKHF